MITIAWVIAEIDRLELSLEKIFLGAINRPAQYPVTREELYAMYEEYGYIRGQIAVLKEIKGMFNVPDHC